MLIYIVFASGTVDSKKEFEFSRRVAFSTDVHNVIVSCPDRSHLLFFLLCSFLFIFKYVAVAGK